ncbi:unnamed protein product [Rhizophagus irregularis]|nr:unnamed protein product [Rhizophagus irregularis]CAB5180368.1 unnamed protein product [Rhizophagus irregularis]
MTAELLREVESHVLLNRSTYIVHCYGLTKNSKSDDFMMVLEYAENEPLKRPNAVELEHLLNELYLKIQQQNSDLNEQIKEANEINLNQYRLNVNDIETEYSVL